MSLIKAAFIPHLFKRWLQVHTKCNSYESKERERESPHSQLQVQSHHHITVAKEGRNICKGNSETDLLPKLSNSMQHALKPDRGIHTRIRQPRDKTRGITAWRGCWFEIAASGYLQGSRLCLIIGKLSGIAHFLEVCIHSIMVNFHRNSCSVTTNWLEFM